MKTGINETFANFAENFTVAEINISK